MVARCRPTAPTSAPPPTDTAVSTADLRHRLHTAELDVVGRFTSASNATLLVRLRREDGTWPEPPVDDEGTVAMGQLSPTDFAVYKPEQGEAPLWDFPDGTLHRREVAAYEVDRLLGWGYVPLTVLREEAPFGTGMLQRFVPHDPDDHYFALLEEGDVEIVTQLKRMVLFDMVIDNADRKGGHVLLEDGTIKLVDHGVSFHAEPKLRTVGWHFAGEPVSDGDRADLAALADLLDADDERSEPLRALLDQSELARLRERARATAELTVYPEPVGPRPFPWPLI